MLSNGNQYMNCYDAERGGVFYISNSVLRDQGSKFMSKYKTFSIIRFR